MESLDLDIDLDSFIANIEQTAPEDTQSGRLVCDECGVHLEEQVDGNYICPSCSAQATNILQLDETELHYDEQGRPVHGQRVRLTERTSKHQIDYGWAWSTDEAIVHIMNLQIEALEKAGLLPEYFRTAITNLWLKFWLENVAPHIKDEYQPNELIPISTKKALKLRDVEVLVKLHDRVMIPLHHIQRNQKARLLYKMYGTRFYPTRPEDRLSPDGTDTEGQSRESESIVDESSSSSSMGDFDRILLSDRQAAINRAGDQEQIVEATVCADASEAPETHNISTRNLSDETIAILTLNRTLAFIEATARCLQQNDPLFAADIIRACNQRLIPFYNVAKILPDNMKLNPHDRLMFQKIRPPTPIQLTRTASLLIHKVYQDQPSSVLPVPNLGSILERFIQDMNLPYELFELIRDDYSFADFTQTRPTKLSDKIRRRPPQYDRWAFAVLLCQIKKLFNLSDECIKQQSEMSSLKSLAESKIFFDLGLWIQQMSLRLKLILRYDPFVLYHPLTEVDKLEATPQMASYLGLILDDRITATIKTQPGGQAFDEIYRNELDEFLKRELPILDGVNPLTFAEEQLEISSNIKYPLSDAIRRTRRFWGPELESHKEVNDLIYKTFTMDQLLLPGPVPRWCIYDDGLPQSRWRLKISPEWPYSFKLLLRVGAFICLCDPEELLNEVRLVEEKFYPQARAINLMNLRRSHV